MNIQPFHIAIPVLNLSSTRQFYGEVLGCAEGRSCNEWIDWNFFGHQLSTHVKPEEVKVIASNKVDGKNIPVRHFGIVLEWNHWHELAKNLEMQKTDFIIEPYVRFKGEIGEQATMFLLDPSGNALEFKSFKDIGQLFAK
jgi:extradiol dioxygenase family protein